MLDATMAPMEPPRNHPDAFNPGLADPDRHDGLSFSVGHSRLEPDATVPIPPYANRTAAYYAACDPLTALRDAATEAMVRHALAHERVVWPKAPVADPTARDDRTAAHYGSENLAKLDRIHSLAGRVRAGPHRPVLVHHRPVVGFNTFRGDSDQRLVAECQALIAGRFDNPGQYLFDEPEPPWDDDSYQQCRNLIAGHSPTHCWVNDCDDSYIIYTSDSQQAPLPLTVGVILNGPGPFSHPIFDATSPIFKTLGSTSDLDAAAELIAHTERQALARDLIHLALHCTPAGPEITDMFRPPRDTIVSSALLDHHDHRPLDYHGTPAEWASWAISPVNSTNDFVAFEPLDPGLELDEATIEL